MVALRKSFFTNTVIGASVFAIAPLIFVYSQSSFENASGLFLSYPYWLFIFYFLCIYFLLKMLLLPKLYLAGKTVLLSIAVLLLMLITLFVKPFDRLMHYSGFAHPKKEFVNPESRPEEMPLPGMGREEPGMRQRGGGPKFDIVSIFLLMMALLLVIADHAVKRSRLTEQRALQAEADRANAELSFLKAQINPHFLFNTLNNIYSLAVTKNDHAPDAIMKLSNIMRYVTDEANETLVPLQDEIDCIHDYISLQKLRLGENYAIEFSVTGNTVGSVIPPLVLMTFVENAFKHGVSNHEESSILLKLLVQDKYIHFFAQNKLFATARNAERTGVGIENTTKRIQVLYPEKHVLKITKENELYAVELVLFH